MAISSIDRVLVAVTDLERARDTWRKAGFALVQQERRHGGVRFSRIAAGAVAIEFCSLEQSARIEGPFRLALKAANERGGGAIGWVWGASGDPAAGVSGESGTSTSIGLPDDSDGWVEGAILPGGPPGVFTATVPVAGDPASRRERLRTGLGPNPNTVEYLDHIVVMTPKLEDATSRLEAIGVECRRVRDAGRGMRQAFFKLDRTVIEVVGPAGERRLGIWGLAFMCGDVGKAVATARANGLEATEPKTAVQGGLIARLVEPLDGVAVALMQLPPN